MAGFLLRALPAARILIITLWAGSIWTVGYLAAPTLFSTLTDRVLAGTIAGSLFRIEAWLSLACAALLYLLFAMEHATPGRRVCQRLVLAMALCVLIGYFGLQPWMAGLREAAGPAGVMEGAARTQFGLLHGAASLIYLLQSLLAVLLVLKSR